MTKGGEDDDLVFLRAMRALGVGPGGLEASGDEALDFDALMRVPVGSRRGQSERAAEAGRRARADEGDPARDGAPDLSDDDALFEAAVAAFARNGAPPAPPAEAPATAARPAALTHGSPRTLARRIRAGVITEERTLDLHGMTRDRARRELGRFLEGARRDGLDVVKVVTGRGLHSVGDAVLLDAVAGWLNRELRGHVRQVVKAPASHGGAGARYVFLRPRDAESR